MEEFILVTKINIKDETNLKQFCDLLKKENIKYKEKLEENWIGIKQPKYIANIALYVSKNDEERVKEIIEELDNATIKSEVYNELKNYTEEEKKDNDKELKKYEKRQKMLQKIMVYGIFLIVAFCIILTIVSNFMK